MTDSSPLILRPAAETDREQVINLSRLSFMPMTGLAEVLHEWVDRPISPAGRPSWVAVNPHSNAIVGRYRHLDLTVFFQGATLPIAGVGSVSVSIEHRGQKVAGQMLEHALQHFRDRQIPLSMLYPFQHGFYRSLGWAWVDAPYQYRVATRHLPCYPERVHITSVQAADQAAVQSVYDQAAPLHNGWLIRQPWHWEEFFKPEGGYELYHYVEAGSCQGYVAISFKRLEPAKGTWTIVVEEWVALTAAAYRGILGFLASLRDQIETIIWNTHAADPFPHLLKEQRLNPLLHPASFEFGFTDGLGAIGGGFMWRLVDVAKALELRPIHTVDPFEIGFQIADPVLGDQKITVEFRDRAMQCSQQPASTVIQLSIEHLTVLFCGVRSAQDLLWTGEIAVDGDASLLAKLDAAWQATPPFCWDFF
jgi:predicted acetyltransferase